jgi:hypothetical protein
MAKMTKEEAFRAGYQNPIAGDISPLQRLYGTVQAMGEELSGADMGTPFGQRFSESQARTKQEIKRLQALRDQFPEDFGYGMALAQDRADPANLGLLYGTLGAMRPGTTTYSQLGGAGQGPVEGEFADVYGIGGPRPGIGANVPRQIGYAPQPQAPYYRNVPGEMGTSFGPMSPFQQNQVGLSTGRYGAGGYAPEMAVTDFETYGPFSRAGATAGQGANTGFDQNMYQAYLRGRFARGGAGPVVGEGGEGTARMMGMGYSAEDLGQAVAPYRQGGLVYEPVGQQAGPRQIGGPGMAQRLGYERGPIEGEFSDVYGIAGPRTGSAMTAGPRPYGGSMDFGVTRDGMAAAPSGMMFDPRVAASAAGLGYLAGLPRERETMATAGGATPRGEVQLPPIDVFGPRGASVLSGQAPGAGTAFEAPKSAQRAPAKAKGGAAKSGTKGKSVPLPPRREQEAAAGFEPNFNYLVTAAIDRLLGQREAERGREFQQYYERNPL